MKNLHFARRILFTIFKWIMLDITLLPRGSTLFKLSFDLKTKCSMPGIYVNFSFLKLFNLWFSITDERLFDEKRGQLYEPMPNNKPLPLTDEQLKSVDGLLGDWMHLSPRFDQIFIKYNNLPETIISYKSQLNELFRDMENYIRSLL